MTDLDQERALLSTTEYVQDQLAANGAAERARKIEAFVRRVLAAGAVGVGVDGRVWPAWPTWLEAELDVELRARVRGVALLALADRVPLPDVRRAAEALPRVSPERLSSAFRLIASTLEDSEDPTVSRRRQEVLAWLVEYARALGDEETVRQLREWTCRLIVGGVHSLSQPHTTEELELFARALSGPLTSALLDAVGLSAELTPAEDRRVGAADRRSVPALPLEAALAAARDALSALSDHVTSLALPGAYGVLLQEEIEQFERLTRRR
jgi:hypothetical protein